MDSLKRYRLVEDLLEDSAFINLLNLYARKCITWDEFLETPLPTGMSARQTWDILNKISRATGIKSAVPDLEDVWYSYRRTHEITDIVAIVSKACSYDSHLYRTVTAAGGRHFLIELQTTEIIAAARLDGLFISPEKASSLIRLDENPQNAVEQLIINNLSLSDSLEDYLDEPFSRDLFLHFKGLLLKNVDVDKIQTIKPSLGLTLFDYPPGKHEKYSNRQMDYISSWANHESGDENEHPAMLAMILCDCFRFYRPLGVLSNQIGNLVTSLYGLKHDLPMYGLLPVSSAKVAWCEGSTDPSATSFDREEFIKLREMCPGDLTSMATIAAQLMLFALRKVEAYVNGWEQRDAELQTLLQATQQFNTRQRSILGRALRNPDAEFSIKYHRINHAIAYPTARHDFLELVEQNYLTVEQKGKAFLFKASPTLKQQIDESKATE